MAKDRCIMWTDTLKGAAKTQGALALALAAVAGALISMVAIKIQLGLLMAAALAYVLSSVHASQRPRVWGLRCVAIALAVFTYYGFMFGQGISLAEVAPSIALLVTFIPGVSKPPAQRSAARWLLAVPLVMVVGGVMAATSPGANIKPIGSFALTAAVTVVMLHRLSPSRDEAYILINGLLWGIVISTAVGLFITPGVSGRAVGLTAQANQYAMFAVFGVPLLWLLITEQRLKPAAGAMVGMVLIGGVLESGSRSGIVALAGVLLLLGVRRVGLAPTLTVTGFLGVMFLTLSPWLQLTATPTGSRLLNSAETAQSNSRRLDYMTAALDALGNSNYVFGTGIVSQNEPHNIILLVWTAMGIVGLLAFGTAVVTVLSHVTSSDSDTFIIGVSVANAGFLLALALNNLIGAPIFWTAMSLLIFTTSRPIPQTSAESTSRQPIHARL